jgi:hypothetical protein
MRFGPSHCHSEVDVSVLSKMLPSPRQHGLPPLGLGRKAPGTSVSQAAIA